LFFFVSAAILTFLILSLNELAEPTKDAILLLKATAITISHIPSKDLFAII
jgi:hypothetical protein